MNLKYTPEAIADLRNLQRYISEILQNPIAADHVVRRILDECAQLKAFPQMGLSVQEKTGYATDLRMQICGNYLAVYRIDGSDILIARIVSARQDYMRILLGTP